MESLSSPDQYLSEGEDGKLIALSELKEGVNPGSVLIVGVAAVVPFKERVP